MSAAQGERGNKVSDVATAAGLAASGMLLGVVAIFFLGGAARAFGLPLSAGFSVILSLFALQGVGLVGTALLYLVTTDRGLGYVKLRKPSLKHVGIGFGGVFAMLAGLIVVSVVLQSLGQSTAQHGTIGQIEQNPRIALYMIPLSLIVIGPGEEFLFRGVIQTKLRESFSGVGAVGVASAIFALIHIPAYGSGVILDIAQQGGATAANIRSLGVTLLILFMLALVLGYVYEKTDNLTVPIITHGFFNAVQFGLAYLSTQPEFQQAAVLF